jgi:hypothetical protein
MGRLKEALRQYHLGIRQIEGEQASLYYGVATSLCGLDRRQEALAWFERAIDIDPAHSPARCDYGIALLKLGQPTEALRVFDAALERDRHLPVAWYGRGVALINGQVSRTRAAHSFIAAASLGSAPAEQSLRELGVHGWREFLSDSGPLVHIHPKVFISYTWESDEHKLWVRKLATELLQHDIDVFFDGLIPAGYEDYDRFSVNEIAQRLQGCHVFMPVFTHSYLAKIGWHDGRPTGSGPDGWVFDEWQLSLRLGKHRMIETIPVLREGEPARLPRPFSADNIVDLRPGQDHTGRLARLIEYIRDERAVILALDMEAVLDGYFSRRKRYGG